MNRWGGATGFADGSEIGPLTEQQVRTLESQLTEELRRLVPESGKEGDGFGAGVGGLPPASRRKVEQLVAALGRMAAGSYGVCAGCGDRIAFERLDVIPETALCMQCSAPVSWEG